MRTTICLSFVIVALALVSCGGGQDQTPTPSQPSSLTPSPSPASSEGTWTSLAPLPTPRSEVAVAAVNGLIYVVGGFEGNGAPSDKVEVYDPATDTWSEAPPLPRPRHHTTAVAWQDCKAGCLADLLVIGGYQSGFNDPQITVFRYDTEEETWSESSPLLVPRGGHSATLLSGGPIIVGGAGPDGKSLTSAELMDGITEQWHPFGSDISSARDHLAVASVDILRGDQVFSHLYAVGGRRDIDFGRNLSANETAQLNGNWETASPLPTARSGIAAVALGINQQARIYVFGGEGSSGTFDNNEVYDPEADTWETAEPMPTARHGHGAAVVDGVIYVIGGGPTPGLSVTNANEAFRP